MAHCSPLGTGVFFLKFHKVGGTTVTDWLVAALQASDCSRRNHISCSSSPWPNASNCHGFTGERLLPGQATRTARACLGHNSLFWWNELKHSPAAGGVVTNGSATLLPAAHRMALLLSKKAPAAEWLGCPRSHPRTQLMLVAMLRDPTEKLRAQYYFRSTSSLGREHIDFRVEMRSLNLTFDQWMLHQDALPPRGSLTNEYTSYLCRATSRDKARDAACAISALGSWFDVIGLTERITEAMVEMGRLLSLGEAALAQVPMNHERANLDKKPWTTEQRAIAVRLTMRDMQVWAWANRTSRARLETAWGSAERLDNAVAAFVATQERVTSVIPPVLGSGALK
jgi:hypothetical protein